MIKSVKVFPFSFWKIIIFFFYFIKIKPPAQTCKMAAKCLNSLDTNSMLTYFYSITNLATGKEDQTTVFNREFVPNSKSIHWSIQWFTEATTTCLQSFRSVFSIKLTDSFDSDCESWVRLRQQLQLCDLFAKLSKFTKGHFFLSKQHFFHQGQFWVKILIILWICLILT